MTIAVTGAGVGFVTRAGTSTVTIPAAHVSAMTLDTSDDNMDAIRIISDAVPITITADSGGGKPVINLGDQAKNELISGTITNASNGALSISSSGTTTITGNLISQGSGGVTLAGSGTIKIAGNINLGPAGNLIDFGSGPATISGTISGDGHLGIRPCPGTHRHVFQPCRDRKPDPARRRQQFRLAGKSNPGGDRAARRAH